MTTINAGNTLVNQYAPPFVITDAVTTNWQLRYNVNLLAFEAFDPSENVTAAGFDTIESILFPGVVSQQVFVLPWAVDTTLTLNQQRASLYITIQGVKQHTGTYGISVLNGTTTVTLGGAANDDVEFIGLQTTGGATIELATATGDGVETTVDLSWLAPSEQSLLITLNGIKQDTTAYSAAPTSLTGTSSTVTFVIAPANLADIEIVGITTTGEVPASPIFGANTAGNANGVAQEATFGRVFKDKTVAGENQTLNFRPLFEGTGITLTETATYLEIAANVATFSNLGSGAQVIAPVPGTTDPLTLHSLNGSDRVTLALISDVLTWGFDYGYVKDGTATVNAVAGDRVIGVSNTGVPVTVNLLSIAELPEGDTITIKDESGGAATNNITVTPASEFIDGAGNTPHVINTNYGYVTLYSDGINYFIIAEG